MTSIELVAPNSWPDDRPFPLELTLPVLWGYMDAMGHVNNTVYFRFFESSRTEYMRRMDLHARVGGPDAVSPILASTRCDFLRPLTWPDEVIVGTRTTRMGRTSFTMEYRVQSVAQKAVVARGDGVIVVLSTALQKPIDLGPDLRAAIERLESPGGAS